MITKDANQLVDELHLRRLLKSLARDACGPYPARVSCRTFPVWSLVQPFCTHRHFCVLDLSWAAHNCGFTFKTLEQPLVVQRCHPMIHSWICVNEEPCGLIAAAFLPSLSSCLQWSMLFSACCWLYVFLRADGSALFVLLLVHVLRVVHCSS